MFIFPPPAAGEIGDFALVLKVNAAQRSERKHKLQRRNFEDFKPEEIFALDV